MSSLTGLYGGGLKPKFQEFTSSGTFTPSAGLLAQGGIATVHLYGAGGGGACPIHSSFKKPGGAGGGGAGEYKRVDLTLTAGAITVTLGTGGASVNLAGTVGNNGGNSTFGALITALGGGGGKLPEEVSSNPSIAGRGGMGGYGSQFGQTGQMSGVDSYGDGGHGGSAPNIGIGGIGGISGSESGGNGGKASGGGGGRDSNAGAYSGGAGGNGYCLVEWWE